ncbi:MAG: DUF3568 family protein [Nitrospirota bacterium]
MRSVQGSACALLLAGLLVVGCASAPATKSAAYTQGELHAVYPNTMFRTFEASRAALQDLDMTITNSQRDTNRGVIDAVRKDGTRVHLTFQAQRPDVTETAIKVGTFGSEDISRDISRRIERNLERG